MLTYSFLLHVSRSKVLSSACQIRPQICVFLCFCRSSSSTFNTLPQENANPCALIFYDRTKGQDIFEGNRQHNTARQDGLDAQEAARGAGQQARTSLHHQRRQAALSASEVCAASAPKRHCKVFSQTNGHTTAHIARKAAATPPLASRWSVLPAALSVTVWLVLLRSPSPASFPRHLFHTRWLPPSSLALPSYLAPGSRPYPKVLTQVLAAGRVRISLLLLWQVQGCL